MTQRAWQNVDLNGKVALITGAASGLGRETARLLASQGMHAVVADLEVARAEDVAEAIRSEGFEAIRQAVGQRVVDAGVEDPVADRWLFVPSHRGTFSRNWRYVYR